jgi:hypothetical protein
VLTEEGDAATANLRRHDPRADTGPPGDADDIAAAKEALDVLPFYQVRQTLNLGLYGADFVYRASSLITWARSVHSVLQAADISLLAVIQRIHNPRLLCSGMQRH